MRFAYSRARVTTPEGRLDKVRFIFLDGTFAVWEEDRGNRTATRRLRGEGATFTKSRTNREPSILTLSNGTELQVQQQYGGGCGCKSVFKGYDNDLLVSPDFDTIT